MENEAPLQYSSRRSLLVCSWSRMGEMNTTKALSPSSLTTLFRSLVILTDVTVRGSTVRPVSCHGRRQTDCYAGCFVVLSGIFADQVMIVCGLICGLVVSKDKWVFHDLGCVAMFWNLLLGMKSSEKNGESNHRQLALSLVDHRFHCLRSMWRYQSHLSDRWNDLRCYSRRLS